MMDYNVCSRHFRGSLLNLLQWTFITFLSFSVNAYLALNSYFPLFSAKSSLFFLETVLILLHLSFDCVIKLDLINLLWALYLTINNLIFLMHLWFLKGLDNRIQTIAAEAIHEHVLLLSLLIMSNLVVYSLYWNILLVRNLLLSLYWVSLVLILLGQKLLPEALISIWNV